MYCHPYNNNFIWAQHHTFSVFYVRAALQLILFPTILVGAASKLFFLYSTFFGQSSTQLFLYFTILDGAAPIGALHYFSQSSTPNFLYFLINPAKPETTFLDKFCLNLQRMYIMVKIEFNFFVFFLKRKRRKIFALNDFEVFFNGECFLTAWGWPYFFKT
jgi:hypothetical protein